MRTLNRKKRLSAEQACSILIGIVLVVLFGLASFSETAHAVATTTLPSNSTAYIPRNAALLKMGSSNATVTWSSSVQHSEITNANSSLKTFCIKRPSSTTTSTTINNICTVVYKNAATIGGRPVNARMSISQVTINARYSNSSTYENATWMGIFQMGANGTYIGISGSTDDPYCYRAQMRIRTDISLVWGDTGAAVNLPFFTAASDIDINSSGKYFEGWEPISGFTGTYYTFPSSTLAISGNRFSAADTEKQSGNESWFRGGVIGPLSGSTLSAYYYEANSSTGLFVYSSYLTISNPAKSVSTSKALSKNDSVTFTVSQKLGTYRQDMYTAYRSFTMEDILPKGLTYKSMSVYYIAPNGNGTDLSANVTSSYDNATRKAAFELSAAWLSAIGNYTGGTIKWSIVCKVNGIEEPRTTISNNATCFIDQMRYGSNTVTITVEGPPRITVTKRVRVADVEPAHGTPSFLFMLYNDKAAQWGFVTLEPGVSTVDDGYYVGSYVFHGLSKATYKLVEIPATRYKLESITGDGTVSGGIAEIDLSTLIQGKVTFTNKKINNEGLSDSHAIINHFGS